MDRNWIADASRLRVTNARLVSVFAALVAAVIALAAAVAFVSSSAPAHCYVEDAP
jgi:hypothetical protein